MVKRVLSLESVVIIVSIFIAVIALITVPLLHLTQEQIVAVLVLVGAALFYTILLHRSAQRWGWARLAPITTILNTLCVSLAFAILYDAIRPAWLLYLSLPLVSAILFSRRWTYLTTGLAMLGYLSVVALYEPLAAAPAEHISLIGMLSVIALLADSLTRSFHRQRAISQTIENQLRESEERLERLVHHSLDIISRYRLVPTPRCEYISPAATAITGFTPEEFYAAPDLIFRQLYPEDRERMEAAMHNKSVSQELQIARWYHKDGSTIWLEQRNVPVYDRAGNLVALESITRDVTDREQIQQELREKVAALQVLAETQQAVNSTSSLSDRISVLLEHAIAQLHADFGGLALLEPETQMLNLFMQRGPQGHELVNISRKSGEGAAGWVVQHGETLAIPNVLQDPRWVRTPFSDSEHFASYLGVPLQVAGRTIGVLDIVHCVPRQHSREEIDFLTTLANQAATAIQNARLFEQAEQRAIQLSTLNEIGRAVSTLKDLNSLLELIYQQVQRILPLDAFIVCLYDPESGKATYPLAYDCGKRYEITWDSLPEQSGLSETVKQGQPYLINRTAEELAMFPKTARFGDITKVSASLLLAPLKVGAKNIGAISAQSYQLNAYRNEHLELLNGIASQAAIAIENARLFASEQQRAAELEAVRQASLSLTSSLDLAKVLDTILKNTMHFIKEANNAHIYLYQDDRLVFGAALWSDGHTGQEWAAPRPHGLCYTVAHQGNPIVVSDMRQHPLFADRPHWTGAIVGLPLKIGERVVGVMTLADLEPHEFVDTELHFLRLLGDQAAIAIENAHLFETAERSAMQMSVLNAAAVRVQKFLKPREILKAACDELYQFGTFASVFLLNDQGQLEHIHTSMSPALLEEFVTDFGMRPDTFQVPSILLETHWKKLQAGEAIIADLAEAVSNELPAAWHDVGEWVKQKFERNPVLLAPLLRPNQMIGVIAVMGKALDTFDLPAVSLFARHVSTALENARLFEQTRHRAEQLSVLNEMSQELASTIDLPAIYRIAYKHLHRLVESSNFGISFYNSYNATITAAFMIADGVELDVAEFPPLTFSPEAVTGRSKAIASGHPIIIDNLKTVTSPDARMIGRGAEPLSAMYIPMTVEGNVIGLMEMQCCKPNAFLPSDAELLGPVANQIGLSVHHAHLFAQTQQRAQELALISQISAAINQPLNLNEVLAITLRELTQALHADRGAVAIFDNSHRQLSVIAEYNPSGTPSGLHERISLENNPSMDFILRERRALAISNIHEGNMFGDTQQMLQRVGITSILLVPLITRDQVLGTIGIDSHGSLRIFTAEEMDFAQTIANQAAAAIDKAQLFEEIQRRAYEFSTLYATIHDLAQQQDMNTLLKVVMERAATLLNSCGGSIYLYDAPHSALELVTSEGISLPLGTRMKTGEGLVGQITQTYQPLIVDDYSTWEHRSAQAQSFPLRAVVGVPITFNHQFIGVLLLHETGKSTRKYTDDDVRLLSLFAAQAAAAVHNTRLIIETRRHANQLTVLNHIAGMVNQTLTLDGLLEVVFQELAANIQADAFSIGLYDEATNEIDFRVRIDQGVRIPASRRPLTESLTSYVIRNKKALHIRDYEKEKAHLPKLSLWGPMQPPRSWLGTPMRVGNAVIGIVAIESHRADAFNVEEANLLSTIADQVATAIEKIRLFEETQQHTIEQSTLSEIARALNATLDVHKAFPAIVQGLHTLTGCERVSLALLDEARQLFTMDMVDPPNQSLGQGTHYPLSATSCATDILAGHPHLTPDLSQEQECIGEQMLYRDGQRSRVNLPLIVGDRVIGTLNLSSSRIGTFDAARLPMLQQIANTIAIAIQNSQLFEAEQTRRAELAALYELSRSLANTTNPSIILNAVVGCAVETIHSTFARVGLLEKDSLIIRAARSARNLEADVAIGQSESISHLPFCQRVMGQSHSLVATLQEIETAGGDDATILAHQAQRVLLVPLRIGDRPLGLLILGEERDTEREPFTAEKIRLAAGIADQAANALQRAQLFAELEESYLQAVLALANAVDAKDTETGDHSARLAEMALMVGTQLEMNPRALEDLSYGAILHDIGKIGVPDAILQKPARLTSEEWERMRQHPAIGWKILSPLPRLHGAAEIVRYHHEWYDGTGYPDGLAGEAIPIGARILAVVDAYGAIVDKRVYKESQPHAAAVEELRRCAGKQFDPQIVDAFVRLVEPAKSINQTIQKVSVTGK